MVKERTAFYIISKADHESHAVRGGAMEFEWRRDGQKGLDLSAL
jgi:hypothetical protein